MRRTLARPASAAVLALTLGLGLSACGDDDAVSAEDRERASDAALSAFGGEGSVTGVDAGDSDDGYAFEVEVTFDGGEDVDVELDEDFNLVGDVPPVPSAAGDPGATDAPRASASPSAGGSDGGGLDDDFDERDLDDDGDNLTGQTLQRAVDAALAETGGGRVTDAERSDDADHAYEVEVDLPGGSGDDDDDDVSVELDEQFQVVRVDR